MFLGQKKMLVPKRFVGKKGLTEKRNWSKEILGPNKFGIPKNI